MDHVFTQGHNYSLYKNKDIGKWIIIYYDFDSDLGQDVMMLDFFNFSPLPDKFSHTILFVNGSITNSI